MTCFDREIESSGISSICADAQEKVKREQNDVV